MIKHLACGDARRLACRRSTYRLLAISVPAQRPQARFPYWLLCYGHKFEYNVLRGLALLACMLADVCGRSPPCLLACLLVPPKYNQGPRASPRAHLLACLLACVRACAHYQRDRAFPARCRCGANWRHCTGSQASKQASALRSRGFVPDNMRTQASKKASCVFVQRPRELTAIPDAQASKPCFWRGQGSWAAATQASKQQALPGALGGCTRRKRASKPLLEAWGSWAMYRTRKQARKQASSMQGQDQGIVNGSSCRFFALLASPSCALLPTGCKAPS